MSKIHTSQKQEEEKVKKMKKIVSLILTIVMVAALGGCSAKGSDTNETTEPVAEDLSGTIAITGSTSVEKILNEMIDEFTALNPDVTINYTGTGSSAGITDTMAGANDIGASSRALKEEEKVDGLQEVIFAYDGIAAAVNPANPIEDITITDLAKIYSGEITNWNQVGGNDAKIVVVSREGASGTRSAFEELIKLEDAGGLIVDATVVEGNGNIQATVAGNKNAIGYVSFSFIDETVKSLNLDGVEATADNAKAGTYSLSRPFLLTYMDADASTITTAFVEYTKSDDAQEFVTENGGIRID